MSLGTERLSSGGDGPASPLDHAYPDTKRLQFLIPLKMAGKNLEIVTSITDIGEGSDAANVHDEGVLVQTHKSPFHSAARRNVASPTLSFGSGAPREKNDRTLEGPATPG